MEDNEAVLPDRYQESIHLNYSTPNKVPTLQIPLTMENTMGLVAVGVLALIGLTYVWVLYRRKRCQCGLCRSELKLEKCIG